MSEPVRASATAPDTAKSAEELHRIYQDTEQLLAARARTMLGLAVVFVAFFMLVTGERLAVGFGVGLAYVILQVVLYRKALGRLTGNYERRAKGKFGASAPAPLRSTLSGGTPFFASPMGKLDELP